MSQTAYAAAIATAGQDDGYSGRILDKIVSKWKAPKQKAGSHRLKLILSVDGDGKLLDCRVQKSSGLDAFDAAVCQAAKEASPYGSPPYGIPATVYFSFWSGGVGSSMADKSGEPWMDAVTGKALTNTNPDKAGLNKGESGEKEGSSEVNPQTNKRKQQYIKKITRELRNSIYIPAKTKAGTYHVTVQIECDKDGNIAHSKMLKSCDDALLNKYVMQGIARAKKVSPPPEGCGNKFDLRFTLIRQGKKSSPVAEEVG